MPLSPGKWTLLKCLAPRPRPRRRPARRARPPLRVEPLEDRSVPAAVFWDGGAGTTSWTGAANWSTDAVPGPADDVTVGAFAVVVDTAATVRSLSAAAGSALTV
ncbi:MAG: hypothetical protein K2X87_04550, partial [Gemmataceae bacterium]|nr:hypothetical protein [Gemmataceae bacterium]